MWRRVLPFLLLDLLTCFSSFAQNTYDSHLTQAKSLIAQQKYGDAVKEAEKAIALDGNRWEAYVIAAKGYSSQKLFDDAIGMLQIALPRAPDDKKPLVRDAIAECRKEQNQGNAPSSAGPAVPTSVASAIGPTATTPTQAEIVLWKSIENSTNPADFQSYLDQYPRGAFVVLAQRHLAEFRAQVEQGQQRLRAQAEPERQALIEKSTWTDPSTGLMWEKPQVHYGATVDGKNFEFAAKYCARLGLLQYADWRLPTAEELQMIYLKSNTWPVPQFKKGFIEVQGTKPNDYTYLAFWTSRPGIKDGEHTLIYYGSPISRDDRKAYDSKLEATGSVLCVRDSEGQSLHNRVNK